MNPLIMLNMIILNYLQPKELVQTMNMHAAMDNVFQNDGCVIVIRTVRMVVMNKDVVRC